MASTISFSGLSASGLDTSSWVDALVSVKQQTITSLEQQKAEKENLLSIVNNIKSYFSSFQTCLQKITDSQYGIASMDLFMQNLALSSNSSIATATATTEAARQSYDVAVDSLATATKATSGYSQFEVKTADLNTTFGTLGGKNGTITVNSQSFNVTTEDTLQNLIDKFKNVGVDAKFDESKGTFTIGMDLNKIDEGATNLKNALKLANNNVSGAVSGSVVYANRNTEFYKLGLNGGDINIEGVKHTITKNGNNYTIQKDGGAAVQMNTLGEFLDYLKSSAVGADDATVDTKGHITIKGATLDKVEGGTNLMDVLNLIESQKRTVSESGALSYIEVRVADLNTKLSALGITGDTTLVAGGTNNTISNDKTLGDIKNILKNAGVDMSVDSRGIITIDTHGNEISGTLLDVLNLDPTKGGTTISSSAHQATLKADGNTKLSELGITTDKKYIAYKSDGTALTTEISNVEGKTVNEFVNALKNSGLDAKFDEKTHQITIKDGYIEGSLADALGMTQLSTSFTENASLNTQLEKLGATGDSTLTIDGGAAKTYDKNTTLETVFNDIKNAGGKVTFKDGNVTIEGVTLGGSLPSLLGLDATTQGTSVTSGKLTAVTGSTSSGGNTESTVEHNIELSTKLGDITGTTSNYTLKVGDGTSTTYTKDSTLQDIKTQIEGAGGKFTINDDNTISIEGVTMSGTVVGALGFDELATGTKFTTVNAVMISGTSNIATGDTTLGNLGLISGSTSGARAVRRAPANPNKTLSINGGTAKTYGADSSLDDIFADIVAAGGTASINSEGYIVINGVHLEGTLVDALGLVETSYKTTITSGDLKVTTSTKSTSSSTLYTDTKGDIAWDSTIGSIVGDTNSYDLKVNGTNKTYNTNTKLSDIKNVIQAAGGTMTINDDNTISINGVEISGSLVDKLGFNSDGVHTVVSSNNPIYYTDGKKSADTGTTFEQLGIGADKRDYAIYKNDGTVVKASSTNGTSSGKTIGDWLRVVNDSLNTANGTRDITYASIDNGVISITGGYVTGSLPTELGIGIKETVTGITMEGSSVSYVEYEPLKYIGNIQTGSGIAGGTMVSSGFMAESIKYQDELGNIHAVTETTKLSEVLDTSGNKIGSGSYTFNVGSYTKTFDADSTTLGDIVNYVNNLNMDTTHDTTTSATLVDGKLTIESNVSITGTLLDKLGFEKQDVSTVAYEIKGTNKAHYSKSEGVTVTASGFSTAVTTQSTSGTDKVYVSSLSDFVSGSTYYVKSASDLNKLAELTNAGKNTSGVKFVLENDVDLAGQQFVPIGTYNNRFKGNFYGNGHVIKNLTITDTSVLSDPVMVNSKKIYHAGLFGVIDGAKLYDIGLGNVNINLSIDGDDDVYAGALVGMGTWSSEINNCYSTGSVSAEGYAGGLVGVADSLSVLNSYSTVNVNGHTVGGLVASLTGRKISNSFATGNVNGLSAGGLVGIVNSSTISNSFATGNVVSNLYAGGLVGAAYSGNITISDSFAMGNVTGATDQGGVVGTDSATTTVTNCGYSGSTGLASGVTSGATAMTDAQLKSSIEGLGISSATVVNKTVDTTATTSTTIKDLIGKGGSQTLTLTPTAGGSAVTLTFNETDTIQTVIDKLKAQGIDEADLTDGIFRIKDDKQWTLNGSSELVNKLFGGDDRTYGAEGPQVTYQVTQSSVGGYTGNKITYTTTTTGTVGSVTGSQLTYTTSGTGTAGSVTGNKVTYETTGTGTAGSVTGDKLTYTVSTADGSIVSNEMLYKKLANNSMSISGNKVTYTTTGTGTAGGSGDTTSKTYSGSVLKTVSKGYSTDTKLVDIDSNYKGTKMYVYKKESSTSGTGTTPVRPGTSGTSGKPGSSVDMNENILKPVYEQVATLSIDENTTIQDVIDFYNPYLDGKSYINNSVNTYSLEDGTITLSFKSGYSTDFKHLEDDTVSGATVLSFGMTTPTVATTSTKLYELETSPEIIASLNVTNNGNKYSFDAGSAGTDSPTIQDVLDFLNNTAGCTATFTDGKLTVTGASDLEFEKQTKTSSSGQIILDQVYDMSILFGGSMPTPTTSTTGSTGGGSTGGTSTHTATGTTKMSELGITDFTINGEALSGINANSTVVEVFTALKNEYGIEASISNGIVTFSATSDNYLEGEIINKFFGSKAVEFSTGLNGNSIKSNKVQYSTTETTSSDVYNQFDILPASTNSTKIFDLYVQSMASPSGKKISSGSITVGSVTFTIGASTTVGDLKLFLKGEACTLDSVDGGGGSLYRIVSNNGSSVSVSGDIANSDGLSLIGYLCTKSTTSSEETVNHNIDNNTTIGQIFGDTTSHTIKVGAETVTLQSTDKLSTLVSKLADKGVTAEIKNSALYLTTSNSTVFSGDIISRFFGQDKVIAGGSTYKYVDIELSTKFSDMEYASTPVFEVDGTQIDGLTKDSTIQDLFNKLASKGINASLSNGKITLTSDTEHTLTGTAVEEFFGGAVTVGSSGTTTTTKTYTGTKVTYGGKAATAYASNTKLADIDVRLIGKRINIINKEKLDSEIQAKGDTGSSSSGLGSTSFDKPLDIMVQGQVASMKITNSTTIDDVVSFLNSESPYVENASYNSTSGVLTVKLVNGNSVDMPFTADSSNSKWGGFADFQVPKSPAVEGTTVTDATTLKELGLRIPNPNNKITVTNNGKTTSFTVGDTTCIGDIIDNLEARAGCTATITDGVLTVTGGEDLAFGGNTTVLKKIFGGSMPTPTTSTTGGGSTGGTITVTATGSTTLEQLGLSLAPSLSVDGNTVYLGKEHGAFIMLTNRLTLDKLFSVLQDQFGITGSITDGKVTLTSDTEHTLTGTVIKKLFGQDSITITPTSGTTTTTKTYTGTKVTYGATPSTGYTTDTKLSTIKSRWVGKRIYVKSSDYTGSTTGYPGNSILFQYMDITNTTTIDDVIKFFNGSAGVRKATYDQTSGELELRLNVDYSVSAPFIQCAGDDLLIGQLATKVKYSFGKTGGSSGSPMTADTTLNDLLVVTAVKNTITVTNNGTTTSFDISQATNLLDIISNLQSVGCTASITDGVLTVTGGEDLAFGGNTTVWKSIFGGSIPTPTTSTTGSTGGGSTGGTITVTATGSTRFTDLGFSSTPGFKVDGTQISITKDSTIDDLFKTLKDNYNITGSITDGKVTLASDTEHTLMGDVVARLFSQYCITITPTAGGSSTHTATEDTTFIDLGYSYGSSPEFKVDGKQISITSSMAIKNLLALLEHDYGITGSITDGKITLSSDTQHTLTGEAINKLFGQDSITITPTAGGSSTHTATGSTKMSELGITDFTVNGSALSGITGDSTVDDVLSKLKSTYGLSEATISDGKITFKSNGKITLSGNLIKGLTGQDSVTITATSSKTCSGDVVKTAAKGYSTDTKLVDIDSSYKGQACTVVESRTVIDTSRPGLETIDPENPDKIGSSSGSSTGSFGSIHKEPLTGTKKEFVEIARLTFDENTTIQDVIDFYNNNHATCTYSEETGDISITADKNYMCVNSFFDGFKTTPKTATTSTTLGELDSSSLVGKDIVVVNNGNEYTFATSKSTTIQDVLDFLNNTAGCTATFTDGKLTVTGGEDLEFKTTTGGGGGIGTGATAIRFCYNMSTLFGGNMTTSTTSSATGTTTTTQTADTTTKLGASGLGLTSFDLTIDPTGDAEPISISGLNGDSTIGDVFKKLAEKGITASMNNGVITLTSNTPCDLTGTIAKKLFGKDSVSLECADEIHDFTMTQVSGTKYQYVSRDLTSYSGAERVSEVSELVAGNKYHISSAEDLVALANFVKNGADTTGSIFMFDNDIDMSGVTGFEGIGTLENAFKGTVYGNGHVVNNMTIDAEFSTYMGLFGHINQATIKDLGVVNANVTGEFYTGILVGHAENSQISNAYTSGTVTSNSTFVGGLVGVLKNSTATNVYSTADVKGACYVGGLIGGSDGSIIEKAFATGKVTAPNGDVGGLIGAMENGGTVKNSYATGDVNGIIGGGLVGFINNASITYTFDTVYSTSRVSGSQYVGGFVGNVNGVTNIKNAVYNRSTGVDAIGNGSATGILGKDYEQMIQKSIMQNAGFTEDKGWVYTANTTPTFGNTTVTGGGKTYLDSSITSLSSGSTYYISTVEQLNNLATLVNNGADTSGVNFVLDNDIDVSSFTNTIMDFEGTFYGNGHSLTGLKTALFSIVEGNAIIRDLALENMSESGYLASFVIDNSTVDNVYSTGSTNHNAGLIGNLKGNATLKNSYSTVNVTSSVGGVGGLVGSMYDNATIENCFAKNTINQNASHSKYNYAGGLVGMVNGGTIKSSYADCNVHAYGYAGMTTTAGSLIGKTSGNVTIENCYATGSIGANKKDFFIGQNDGSVTSSGNVACTGSSISGTPSGFSDGVTFVSNAELNSQARMEELGFTKDKGWVYYTGKAPMLQGKDTSSAGTTFQMSDTTTLDSICQNRENKTLSVTINGETHSKTFKGSDTVGDVANWLNGIDGVTANISNNKFNISGTSQDFRVDGELADVLFGNNKTTTKQTITENTDSNGLIVGGGQKKIDDNTTVGQLLGVTSGKYAITYIDDSGNLQSGKFSSDEKLSEVLKFLNDNGFQASIVNGVFTATKDGKIATNISGTIGEKLKGENGTVTNTSSGYKTGQLDASSSTKATATTKLADLGIASGSIFIKDNNNNTLGTIQIDNSMTIDDTAQLLANYGFTLGITDGKVTIEGDGTNRIADGTSNLVSQMKLNNWLETKDKLKTDSTVAQMGFGKGSTLGLVLDKKTYNLTFDANATLQDIIDTLGTYGVTASVDSDGKFTATASGNLVLTNELGAYLTKNSAEGYVKEADGYKSKDPLEFKGDKVKLDYDSKVGDILGTGKDGVLRLTLNKDTVVDLTYKADDTMADIIADLKGYGITATIDDGVLKATSNEKTFRFSGEIGKIISGDTPQYDDISTGYVSKDLSYETTNKTNMNNTLKEMGVSSGQIHVLSNDGKIVSTLDIDNSYTVAQVKSLLQPFGMTLSVDENGKFTVASAEGYKLSDSTSNMVSKMGLNNWTTSTEKLTGATTLAQMGFKDGADLNLFLDGIVMNVLSFDANQTVDDIIFGLAAYGIDASVNADGQFTATSKSHTFIMSGGLGSYLTKGTGGYVNSDTAYESYKPLVESKDYVETASKGLDYNKHMTETSTLESLGFAQGGTVRVMLDGKTPYTLQFLATDKVQDVIYALSAYGINAEVKDGRFVAESVNNTFTLTGNLGSYLVQGGAYQNEITGYESNPLTYETIEKLTNDTKLSDLGITRGDINVIKDGKVTDTIHISDNTTIGQLFSAIKPYGMTGEIVTKANGDTSIRISADSDIKLADGTSNVVSGLGLQEVRKGDFEGTKKYWDDDATSGLITEDTLLSTLDRNGFIAQGSLIFNTGEGDDAVQHIINISANETVGSLLKKFNDSGIKATLDDGVIKLTGGLDKLEFTGGTSGLVETIGLDIHNIDKYASSTSALTYEGETHYSASNFANANTKLDIVNATDGNMSIFVDGVKCNIEVKSSDSFADLFKKIKDKVKARTGLDIQAGFKTKDGSISANPNDADNTGIIGLEIEKGHELVVGASNDTTNFATIANLNKTDYNAVTGSRALYRVNVNSLITESGLYRDGDITEGTFKIGDAEFTIDSTTTLASLINQINKNDKAYANAYWDTLAGTLVIESTVTGASLINIEAGTSNFTDIMGFTKTKDGVSALVTDSQTLGQNAVVRINGTTVTSATNVITSDISKIKGLTINLKNVSAGETVTISVEQDKEAIYSAVSDTLDAYNSMMEALGKELADKNSLGGESILKLMRNNLKRLMTSSLTGAYVFKNLASVGISTGEASDKISTNVTSLLIDKDKFMDALNTDSDAVQDLLVGTKANPGIFLQANNIVESSINTEGYFSNMANTLSKSISNIEKKISKNNLAIENYRTKLETKFHNMELTISGLQSAYANILK